ncbi:MAG TPA: HNH endonuclease signature motif containing protein, partial [Motilibacterales bacterium]|nr:HNH endonuclease signature motif containing protein [Motilibacterales bacterium]
VTCRFPGCTVPARECDLDHLIPFPEGPTSAANLHALCRRHHRLKHNDGWTVTALPDSGLRWTSPLGTTRDTWPDTDHTHQDLTHTTQATHTAHAA